MTYYISTYPTRMARRMMMRHEANQPASHVLPLNIREEQDAYVLSALVPGLKADDLNIQILEDVVTIEGTYIGDENEYMLQELPTFTPVVVCFVYCPLCLRTQSNPHG
jgi:HSP20 family molecular chaperone IbpA